MQPGAFRDASAAFFDLKTKLSLKELKQKIDRIEDAKDSELQNMDETKS